MISYEVHPNRIWDVDTLTPRGELQEWVLKLPTPVFNTLTQGEKGVRGEWVTSFEFHLKQRPGNTGHVLYHVVCIRG